MRLLKAKLIAGALTLFSMLPILSVCAQEETIKKTEKGALEFGLHHGFNFTTFTGTSSKKSFLNSNEEVFPSSARFTLDIGMFATHHLNKKLSFQGEIMFTFMGAQMTKKTSVFHELGQVAGKESFTYRMNYMKMPLILNYYPSDKLYLSAGVYGAMLLHSSKAFPSTNEESEAISESVNAFDAGFLLGAGFKTDIVNIGFRYNYGIVPVFNDDEFDWHHSIVQFVLQFKLYSEIKKMNDEKK